MTKKMKLGLLLAVVVAVSARSICAASSSGPWDQPSATLAQQIADILGPGQARLSIENKSSIAIAEIPKIRKLLEQDLKSHGVTASGAESASAVRVTLSENARNRLWVAEVVEGDRTQVTMVNLVPVIEARPQSSAGLMLRAQTILNAHAPVLAALEVPGGLVVLEPEQLEFFAHTTGGLQSVKQVIIRQKGVLARDPRGVLAGASDGQSFNAWLNGTECTGPEGAPDPTAEWPVECRASDDPWPITSANALASDTNPGAPSGSSPQQLRAFYNAARNYFTGVVSPAASVDLPPFYSAALVPRPAGGAALLIGGVDGKVQLVENGALWPVAGTRDWGSDFAVLHSGCGTGTQVIASGSGEAVHDSLRAYELTALEANPASAPIAMDGTLSALWNAPDGKSLFAVVRNTTNQYEVERVTALCN